MTAMTTTTARRLSLAILAVALSALLGACGDDSGGTKDMTVGPDSARRDGRTEGIIADGPPGDVEPPDGPAPDTPADAARDLVERFDGSDGPDAGVDAPADADAGSDVAAADSTVDTVSPDSTADSTADTVVDSFPNDSGPVTRRLVGIAGGDLVAIQAASGATSVIGAHGLTNAGPVTFDPSTQQIFTLLDQLTTAPRLARIDPCTGAGTVVGTIAFSNRTISQTEALAYDAVNNVLYTTMSLNGADSRSESLVSLDKTTAAPTLVTTITGTLQNDGDSLMFIGSNAYMLDDPGSGPTGLYTFNVSTGVATLVGSFSSPRINNMTQLAHDPISNITFSDGGSNQLGKLLTINLTTATATVGPTIQASSTVRRIAFVNVTCPAPSGG